MPDVPATTNYIARLSADRISASEEIVLAPSGTLHLGGKALDTAVCQTVSIALAASLTTDGMEATITVKDGAGVRIAGSFVLEVWISESAAGAGLTADTYSGDVTATTGAILTAHTEKKHFSVATAISGVAVILAVDSANPADQYVCAKNPFTGRIHVSAVSGLNWEGAA